MIQHLAPSNEYKKSNWPKVFMAGSIENGTASNWAETVCEQMAHQHVILLNPRREFWDPYLTQSINDPTFKTQVEWELEGLETSNLILMYFDPVTKSPISLLEFGMYVGSGKLIVACPKGFWRRGNLEVTCAKYGVTLLETLDELIIETKRRLKAL
jgi:hypothetical protein